MRVVQHICEVPHRILEQHPRLLFANSAHLAEFLLAEVGLHENSIINTTSLGRLCYYDIVL